MLDAFIEHRILRGGEGWNRQLGFVHSRFGEYLAACVLLDHPDWVSSEEIPAVGRLRDVLVVFCEIAPLPQARAIADFCFDQVQDWLQSPSAFAAGRVREIRCLRFMVEAFRYRQDAVDHLSGELGSSINERVRQATDPLSVKLLLEGIALVPTDKIEKILSAALANGHPSIRETAFWACRYLTSVPDALQDILATTAPIALLNPKWRLASLLGRNPALRPLLCDYWSRILDPLFWLIGIVLMLRASGLNGERFGVLLTLLALPWCEAASCRISRFIRRKQPLSDEPEVFDALLVSSRILTAYAALSMFFFIGPPYPSLFIAALLVFPCLPFLRHQDLKILLAARIIVSVLTEVGLLVCYDFFSALSAPPLASTMVVTTAFFIVGGMAFFIIPWIPWLRHLPGKLRENRESHGHILGLHKPNSSGWGYKCLSIGGIGVVGAGISVWVMQSIESFLKRIDVSLSPGVGRWADIILAVILWAAVATGVIFLTVRLGKWLWCRCANAFSWAARWLGDRQTLANIMWPSVKGTSDRTWIQNHWNKLTLVSSRNKFVDHLTTLREVSGEWSGSPPYFGSDRASVRLMELDEKWLGLQR